MYNRNAHRLGIIVTEAFSTLYQECILFISAYNYLFPLCGSFFLVNTRFNYHLPTGLGLLVFLDIVHSYSAADEMVGLSRFDGSNDCYFHSGKCFIFPF